MCLPRALLCWKNWFFVQFTRAIEAPACNANLDDSKDEDCQKIFHTVYSPYPWHLSLAVFLPFSALNQRSFCDESFLSKPSYAAGWKIHFWETFVLPTPAKDLSQKRPITSNSSHKNGILRRWQISSEFYGYNATTRKGYRSLGACKFSRHGRQLFSAKLSPMWFRFDFIERCYLQVQLLMHCSYSVTVLTSKAQSVVFSSGA